MGKDPKNTCGQHSCQVISGKERRWGCVCACTCVHVRALQSREVGRGMVVLSQDHTQGMSC